MKHTVTVEAETKKHFHGIPYKTTEKKKITVDGKTYRKMKNEGKGGNRIPSDEEIIAAHYLICEEELKERNRQRTVPGYRALPDNREISAESGECCKGDPWI